MKKTKLQYANKQKITHRELILLLKWNLREEKKIKRIKNIRI